MRPASPTSSPTAPVVPALWAKLSENSCIVPRRRGTIYGELLRRRGGGFHSDRAVEYVLRRVSAAMAKAKLDFVAHYLHKLTGPRAAEDDTDGPLMERFAAKIG